MDVRPFSVSPAGVSQKSLSYRNGFGAERLNSEVLTPFYVKTTDFGGSCTVRILCLHDTVVGTDVDGVKTLTRIGPLIY